MPQLYVFEQLLHLLLQLPHELPELHELHELHEFRQLQLVEFDVPSQFEVGNSGNEKNSSHTFSANSSHGGMLHSP